MESAVQSPVATSTFTCRVFLPDERSLGEQPAYLESAPGSEAIDVSDPMMVEANTSPQPEAV